MENSIEEDVAKVNTYIELVLEKDYCNCNELNAILGKHCDGSKNIAYAMQHILSAYRRVLKENEELNNRCKNLDKEAQAYVEELMGDSTLKDRIINRLNKENEELKAKWNKDTHILQNKLDYANADRIDLAQQNKELRKENEELNNRCRNLDKEAQAYLEELAGDNTLTRRTIKQLQEENEELKKDYYNVINKIENKIDILDIVISECIYIDDDDKAYKKAVKKDKLCLLNQKRALQELLEGGQS